MPSNTQTSAAAPITVSQTSFGIFTIGQSGMGPGAITDACCRRALIRRPGRRDQVMSLWCTGPGTVDFHERNPRAPVRDIRPADFQVLVGGRPARADFAGRSPNWPGLDRVNFVVFRDVEEGCYVPVVVPARGVMSNSVSRPVSQRPDRCSDPMSLSEAGCQFIGEGKQLRIGRIALTRTEMQMPAVFGIPSCRSDEGTSTFAKCDFSKILRSRGLWAAEPFGQCVVYSLSGQQFDPEMDPAAPVPLDPGPPPYLTGPRASKRLPRREPGDCQASLGDGMPGTPGAAPSTSIRAPAAVNNGAGGADVGQCEATLTISSPMSWTRPPWRTRSRATGNHTALERR
ncbi:MAG: hypothetical protein RMI94_10625 [Bryobacterales bacterium]|nr:hypothetical protein [Bryobacterales bacterium]